MTLVNKIQDLCRLKGTNQSTLERELGFGKGTISKWDKSSPSADKLQSVADYFHVSIDFLMSRENEDQDVFFLRGGDKLDKAEKEELKKIMQMSADVYLRAKGLIK